MEVHFSHLIITNKFINFTTANIRVSFNFIGIIISAIFTNILFFTFGPQFLKFIYLLQSKLIFLKLYFICSFNPNFISPNQVLNYKPNFLVIVTMHLRRIIFIPNLEGVKFFREVVIFIVKLEFNFYLIFQRQFLQLHH